MSRKTTAKPDARKAGRDLAAFSEWAEQRVVEGRRCAVCRNPAVLALVRDVLEHPSRARNLAAAHKYAADHLGFEESYGGLMRHVYEHERARHREWLRRRYAE